MAKSKAKLGLKIGLGFLETVIHVCVYIIVVFVFIRAATLGFDFSYQVFGNPSMSKYDESVIDFEVPEGTYTSEVAKQLEEHGLVKYDTAFVIKMKLSKLDNSLVPGTYKLSPAMTSDEIMVLLTTPVVDTTDEVQAGEDASGTIVETEEGETQESETVEE